MNERRLCERVYEIAVYCIFVCKREEKREEKNHRSYGDEVTQTNKKENHHVVEPFFIFQVHGVHKTTS